RRGIFQSSNPYLTEENFRNSNAIEYADEEKMTVSGAVNKTFLLGSILLASAAVSFTFTNPLLTWGGAIGGLIIVFLTVRKMEKASTYAPLYAVLEGFFIGGITAMYAAAFNGIVLQAVTLTFAVFFGMLAIYKSGLIKVTKSFRSGIMMATFGIFILYMVSMVLGLFGINMPFLHQATPLSLIISLGILAIAALNLLLDFDQFEKGEEYGAPIYMEWFAAMGLLITLVWIYVEILRILAIFTSRD
ncbi:MAG: Bax inhibitor-1/YccA family protein, partial [Saprospiraceae bacterium]|nr:Bax inhibitor-1/YccA family protein [Saprospiraceae bacterium]